MLNHILTRQSSGYPGPGRRGTLSPVLAREMWIFLAWDRGTPLPGTGVHTHLSTAVPVPCLGLQYPPPLTGVTSPPAFDWGAPTWDWGTPHLGLGYPHLGLGYRLPGTGVYQGPVTGVPPGKGMGPVEVLWNGDWVPPWVWTDRQTPVKTIPSPSFGCGR